HCQQAFPQTLICGEVPPKQHEQRNPDKKRECRGHEIANGKPGRCFASVTGRLSIADCFIVLWVNGSTIQASFKTVAIADFSISIFTLSATFTSTVFS